MQQCHTNLLKLLSVGIYLQQTINSDTFLVQFTAEIVIDNLRDKGVKIWIRSQRSLGYKFLATGRAFLVSASK